MLRDNVSFAVRPPAWTRLAPPLLLGFAAAAATALPAPAGAQPVRDACDACVHETIRHEWRIDGHPRFSAYRTIASHCAAVEYEVPKFKVVSDGTQVSRFDVKREVECGINHFVNPRPYFLDEAGEEITSPDPDQYGIIEVEDRGSDHVNFLYTNPTDPPPKGQLSRLIWIMIEYHNTNTGSTAFGPILEFDVFRPPVVMVHGLWAYDGSFKDMEENFSHVANDYPRELLYRVDYSGSNDSSFSYNTRQGVVSDGVVTGLRHAADEGYAAGKADLVGHSMGGILSRLYLQGSGYNKDVRRLVTCNTPHSGSQMGNWLLDEEADWYGASCWLLESVAGMGSCYNGAVCDLNVLSSAINGDLNGSGAMPADVEVHALSTVYDLADTPIPTVMTSAAVVNLGVLGLYLVTNCSPVLLADRIFGHEECDTIVALRSQAGGLQGQVTSLYADQRHDGSVANQDVMDAVRDLLDEPKDNDRFATTGYSPPALSYFTPAYCSVLVSPPPSAGLGGAGSSLPGGPSSGPSLQLTGRSAACASAVHASAAGLAAVSAGSSPASTLSITSPASGTSIGAGQSLSVSVAGSADVATIVLLLRYRTGDVLMEKLAGPSATFSFQFPVDLVGPRSLVAAGFDASGRPVAKSNDLSLDITVAATLQSVSVYPPAVYLDPGGTRRLSITGSYSDAVERDLSQLPGVAFAFAEGHASRSGASGVTLDERLDDALTVTYQGVAAPQVPIRALPPEQPRLPKGTLRRHLPRT